MATINEQIQIPESELSWSFVRSGGPGGQNVNKVASKAVLRWNVIASPNLPEEVKSRLLIQQRGRMTNEGELVITSQLFRDQEKNRHDCLEKLRAFILQATVVPKRRKKTRPSRASKERRVAAKRHRAKHRAARRTNDE
jgi:ribosome-associated protein